LKRISKKLKDLCNTAYDITLDDFRLKEIKINRDSKKWIGNKDFLKIPKENYYSLDKFEYIVPKFNGKEVQRIGRKHQNFERIYNCFRSAIPQNPITTVTEERETIRVEANKSKDNSDNSPTLSNYQKWREKDVKLQKSSNNDSINSDIKSNEEMKSNSSSQSKMSTDSIKKDEQNFLDDEEYDVNGSASDQENTLVKISTCDKTFTSLHKKEVIKSDTKKNEEITLEQKEREPTRQEPTYVN
jgi:thymidine kinase